MVYSGCMADTQSQSVQQPETQSQPEQVVERDYQKPQPEEELLEWRAPSRVFKKHNRQFYTTVGMIVLLVGLILFFAGQTLPVAVMIAVVFFVYIQHSIPPSLITYKLTTYGIRIEGELYYWEEMGRFWFTKQYGQDLLHIEIARFPFRLPILTADISKDDMSAVLSEILLNEVPPPTTYEKIANWLHEKVPIDIES